MAGETSFSGGEPARAPSRDTKDSSLTPTGGVPVTGGMVGFQRSVK